MAQKKKEAVDGYGIGAVARITGLTDHTIRVWERRYKAVVARRTGSGHRVYTPAHVEKLGLLKQLTDRGIAIGKIASKSNAALRQAVIEHGQVTTKSLPDTVRVAVLGNLVRTQLLENPGALEIVVADNDAERFVTDLEHQTVDVVIVETAIIDAQALKQMKSYLSLGRAQSGLLVYNFGQKSVIERAIKSGVMVLRSPVSATDIRSTIHRLPGAASETTRGKAEPPETNGESDWRFSGTIAPRRFTQQQLAYLASISSSIECECPQNLAELVNNLTAFEVYSAHCASRDADEAALHHYLHQTCAEARALIEMALEKVVKAEKISL